MSSDDTTPHQRRRLHYLAWPAIARERLLWGRGAVAGCGRHEGTHVWWTPQL